MDLISVDRN